MHVCIDLFIRYVRIDGFMRIYVQIIFEAPGARERKLAGRGLGRGKAWKGSLNVKANTAIMENAPTMKRLVFMLYLKPIKATQLEW